MSVVAGFAFSGATIGQPPKKIEQKSVTATVGFPTTVPIGFVPVATSVGNDKVLRAEIFPGKTEVVVQPQTPGSTKILVRDADGEIRAEISVFVKAKDLTNLIRELKGLLKDIEGVKIQQIGERADKVAVMGDLLTVSDYERVKQLVDAYNTGGEEGEPRVLNLTRVDKRALTIVSRKMEEDIRKNLRRRDTPNFQPPEVSVRVVGNERIFLEGWVESQIEADRAYQIAVSYFPQELTTYLEKTGNEVKRRPLGFPLLVNQLMITPPSPPNPADAPAEKMVKIITQYVEVRNNYLRSIGFNWSPTLNPAGETLVGLNKKGGVSIVPQVPGMDSEGMASYPFKLVALVGNLFPRLSFARSNGMARILDSIEVLTENRVKATLNKLQNRTIIVPSVVQGAGGTTFSYASGIQHTVTPVILGSQPPYKVQLDIDMTVRFDNQAQNVDENTIRTKINVEDGTSAAIGGVVKSNQVREINNSPDRSDILFNLSRSRDFRNNRSQFVIFMTPYVIEDAGRGVDQIRKKFDVRAPASAAPAEPEKK